MKTPLIFTPRSKIAFGIDVVITLFAWLLFIAMLIYSVFEVVERPQSHWISRIILPDHTAATLIYYLIIALIIAVIVVAWSKYNAYLGRVERRKYLAPLNDEELGQDFHLTAEQISLLHSSRVVTVLNNHHGEIETLVQGNVIKAARQMSEILEKENKGLPLPRSGQIKPVVIPSSASF